jgi:hypothetical protein
MVASPIDQQIIESLHQLDEKQKQEVLQFVRTLQEPRTYTARELMQLPAEERRAYITASIEASADVDFEIFN